MNAEEIIRLQQRLEDNDSTFRARWQDTANYIFPRESNINDIGTPGEAKTDKLYDVTAIFASKDMANGVLTNMVPAGQKFFSLGVSNREIQEIDIVKSWMAYATEILHEELFASNYILQLEETLRSLIVFGTGCLYSEWDNGLNFMDWDISKYQIQENSKGEVDTIFLKYQKTAIQAKEKWGNKVGKSILEALESETKKNDKFWFIHVVRPRWQRNPRYEDALNMAWESGVIAVKDKIVIDEGGFREFPYHVPRWTKTSGETHGRGIGTEILPQVKMVNANKRDFNECGNKWVNPALDILQEFEGTYNTYPGARNDVMTLPTAEPSGRGQSQGNFPIGKDSLEFERKVITDAFYGDAFAPITSTGTGAGDRRNELEIQQRIAEAFRKIGSIGRLESELFTPKIERCYLLLVRNGVIAMPPLELKNQNIKVIYRGPLSLAQQEAEVRGSQRGISILAEMEETGYVGAMDNVNVDKATRRILRVYGANEDDIATEDEVEAKREQRQAAAARKEALEAAQVAGQTYGSTTKAPEPGSAAEQLQEVAG